jgi:hypothetical protein
MTGNKARAVPRVRERRKPTAARATLPANVVYLHQRIMPRHTALLARWVEAGRRMGVCDASAFVPDRPGAAQEGPREDYILIWVRENIDPAYMVMPEGFHWVVVDAVRQQTLGRLPSFAAALHFIRPVLPLEAAA